MTILSSGVAGAMDEVIGFLLVGEEPTVTLRITEQSDDEMGFAPPADGTIHLNARYELPRTAHVYQENFLVEQAEARPYAPKHFQDALRSKGLPAVVMSVPKLREASGLDALIRHEQVNGRVWDRMSQLMQAAKSYQLSDQSTHVVYLERPLNNNV